ncbi:MAG: AAA domain-containing protein [Sphaerochaeta sp.]
MDQQQEQFFDALTADRKQNADVFEKPSARGAISEASEKYSSQAHFIYELLQNADDAEATSAQFALFADKLVFTHNGLRRFSVSNPETEDEDSKTGCLGDINSITSIGNSTKTHKPTIGKFGMGFWAVRQYTATPHIYDSNFIFKIERACVPIRLQDDFEGRHPEETVFVLPFDHTECSRERAYTEIAEKLTSLDYPLLFLPYLRDISFEISGTFGLYGKTIEESHTFEDITAQLIRLTQNNEKNRDELYDDALWLFSRKENKGNGYAVGFFVNAEGHLMPRVHSAFCFFPTKEQTGLNFIFHAPFLLNNSREGILAGIPHNIDMIERLAKLAADSLVHLRDIGKLKQASLIDDNIFDIVPCDENLFSDVNSKKNISFKPFFTEIKKVFQTESIIPSSSGYTTTANAYWAFVPQIAELFSNEQLAALTKNESAKWVFISFGRQDTQRKNSILTNYIDEIISVWLDEGDILKGWSTTDGKSYAGITAKFIELQPFEWLHLLYKWINETNHRKDLIKTKPIFLNQDGKAVAAFDARNQAILFLPTEDGSGYDTVNEALIQNEDTLSLLKQLNISEPSLRDEIYNIILPQYEDDVSIDTQAHFKKFFRYYQTCSKVEEKEFLPLIKECNFVLYTSASDETQYHGKAGELYFPFTPMTQWFKYKEETKFVSFNEYLEIIGEDKNEELITFLSELGVEKVPRILLRELDFLEAYQIKDSWTYSSRGKRWTERYIDGCKEIIEAIIDQKNIDLSFFLWSQLLKFVENGHLKDSCNRSHDSILFGKYKYFYYSPQSETFESSEAKLLRTQPWLVNVNGEFISADDLTQQAINQQYNTSSNDAAELFSLLGIEDEAENENVDLATYAESFGLTREELKEAIVEFAKRKKEAETLFDDDTSDKSDDELFNDDTVSDATSISSSVKRVIKDIEKRATSEPNKSLQLSQYDIDNAPADEDYYSKPSIDISKKIEKIKNQTNYDVREIVRLENLRKLARNANKYSFAWFNALLELESLNSCDKNSNNREISISFAKVELEEGTSRILILKHPNRYIPQSMEDLADIPLELHFTDQPMVKVAVEVVNVKSYTLRAKLKANVQIDSIDLTLVAEARIEAKNPVFLIEELRKAFIRLGDDEGYKNDFDMQKQLCENIEFVFGPPGTGKTTYLAENVIRQLMKESQDFKVLILTPTNKAADVLVNRLMVSMGDDHSYLNWLVRFGTTNDSSIEQSNVFREKTFDIRSFKRNVTVTTIARFPYDYFLPDSITRLHLSELRWDYIIIDEASMIPLANIVYLLYKTTPVKFIIAGDPFQIEPITTVEEWKNENIYTLVGLNSFIKPTTVPHDYHVKLLTTQYRSIPDIGEVFSQFAYGGVLRHARTTSSQRPLPIGDFIDLNPVNIIKFPVSKYESIYRSKRLQSKTPYHVYSAVFSFEFVKSLASMIEHSTDSKNFRIGLITPYRAQADLIDKLMSSAVFPKNIDVQVGTIHGFQGDECDIIIALFNPPPKITTHKDMFLNKLNIVNVSISRAKEYLIVLMPDDDTEDVTNLTLIKRVEHICKEQPVWNEKLSQDIEEMIFGSRTYLEDNSFSTSHQLVNVYSKPEKLYEVRSEDNAVDVQIHE